MSYNETNERENIITKSISLLYKGVSIMKTIVTALIGFGFSGSTFHLPPLLKNLNYKVKYVMTNNKTRQEEAKKDCKDILIATSYEDILNDVKLI